MSLTINI